MAVAAFGLCFLGGDHWHRSIPVPRPVVSPEDRVAQTGQPSVTRLRAKLNKSRVALLDKRLRAAAGTFAQVHDLVRSEYVDSLPTDAAMSRGAVQSMLAALEDEQSSYQSPAECRLADGESRGSFAGIGAVTAVRSEKTGSGYTEMRLLVVAPIPGSPAAKAGLRTGDRITHIDGHYILADNPYLAVDKLATPAPVPTDDTSGTGRNIPIRDGIGLLVARAQLREGLSEKHILTVRREGVAKPLSVAVTDAITVAPQALIRHQMAAGRPSLYVRVGAFTPDSRAAVGNAIRSAGVGESLVLDLRQNAGIGLLDIAENIASDLARPSGPFVIEIGARGRLSPLPIALRQVSPKPLRVSVLTDRGTAGLAEALAAYLADSGATIVGARRTWGDGRSQTRYPLADGSAFVLTTGRLISPKGTGWERVGLTPRSLLPPGLTDAQTVERATAVAGRVGGVVVATRRHGQGEKR